jgi:pSer/pThr/pTyr-binding forkhead associated (FHA) protein
MAADLTKAVLLYRAGEPRDFPLPEGDAMLGFAGDSAVHLPMEGVSRAHAKITFDGKDYWIEDAGSSNGTFLNGIPVLIRERLRHLDVLALGRYTELIFVRKTGEQTRVTRLGIQAAWLETLNGEETGSRIEIPRGSMTIGRAPSNGVIADSQLVSKIHARLERTPLQIVLTDLHSSNGTFMGTERIESRILKNGDEFTLGGSRAFRVHIEEGNVETSGVTPAATVRSGVEQSLPTDWKTRIEWSPEDIAVWEDARKKVRPADTATRRDAHPEAAPAPAKGAAATPAAKPPAAPSKSPVVSGKDATASSRVAAPPEKSKPAPAISAPPTPSATTGGPARTGATASAPDARPATSPAQERTQAPATPVSAVRESPVITPPSADAGASPPPERPSLPATPPPSPAVQITVALPQEAGKARVRLEGKTQAFSLHLGDHEVGRLPGMAICLDGPQISRHHAMIRVTDNETVVEDRGSGNGTFVNMERITVPRRLADGDLLQFGDVDFHVRLPPEAGTSRNPSSR